MLCKSLEIVHSGVLKLSKSKTNLAQCDFILADIVQKLDVLDGTVAKDLKENIITRINQRRTVWSDIFMTLGLDALIAKKSIFYSCPSLEAFKSAIEYLEPSNIEDNVVPINENFDSSNIEDLIKYAARTKRIKVAPNNDIDSFFNENIISERLERALETLKNVKTTSIDSERCFSLCNRVITPLRNRISDEKICTIVFINENKNN